LRKSVARFVALHSSETTRRNSSNASVLVIGTPEKGLFRERPFPTGESDVGVDATGIRRIFGYCDQSIVDDFPRRCAQGGKDPAPISRPSRPIAVQLANQIVRPALPEQAFELGDKETPKRHPSNLATQPGS